MTPCAMQERRTTKARRAAEVLASGDARHGEILLKFMELDVRFKDLEIRAEDAKAGLNTPTWMGGANIVLTISGTRKLLIA